MEKLKILKDGFIKMKEDIISHDIERFKRQIPNILTIIRGFLAPILMIISVIIKSMEFSIIIIIVSSLTDLIDGKIARKYNYVSEFGALIDTICDKIFIFVLILPIFSTFKLYFIIIIVLELMISINNSISFFNSNPISSSIMGKIKTFILDIFVISCYLYKYFVFNKIIIDILIVLVILLQIITFLGYLVKRIKK